ncbi:prolipoprotein diacylglyceryl transferase [Candidatus Schneideria nysicola]|uniref:prolipoprotein diacylglyceryl transferase n=1 Tax=Candidatus Schneideria nysicola TaxID=1081631 RepID=UPI001CAA58BD|nr:prolipoprotein diacylglyceryl transferase [Candidatus Schneideria nysicola]UAJ66252.1 prolipoprotein diacylglyceryl transferase [Candidatus Schneideria nysicola]
MYLSFPQIDPVIFSIGPFSFHWYGLMYILGFIFTIQTTKKRLNKCHFLNEKNLEELLYYSFFGVVFGGRIGYFLFYNLYFFIKNPICIFKFWEGGMSFHGGLIGASLVLLLYTKYNNFNFFKITDIIVPSIPFGLGIGRIANFINGELYGKVAINIPWAILFPSTRELDITYIFHNPEWYLIFNKYGVLPRHPSQIYEMILEGLILFIILNYFYNKSLPVGSISGIFLILYGIFRIIGEYFRQPEIYFYISDNIISMGQILSLPMIGIGIVIIFFSYRRRSTYIQ